MLLKEHKEGNKVYHRGGYQLDKSYLDENLLGFIAKEFSLHQVLNQSKPVIA